MKRHLSMLAAFVALLALPCAVFAHATPTLYEPAASSTVMEPPASIRIRFSENLEPAASSADVFGPDGKALETAPRFAATDPKLMTIDLPASGTGVYTVSWSVLSADDGHATKGAFAFAVGANTATPPARFEITHRSDVAEGLAVWLAVVGHALCLGALAFLFVGRRLALAARDRGSLAVIISVGGLLIAAGESWTFAQIAASLPDNASWTAAFSTVAGFHAASRAVIGVLLLLSAWLPRRAGILPTAALVLLFAMLRARVSHAAASPDFAILSVAVNVLHLLAKEAWIGTVLVSGLALCAGISAARSAESERLVARCAGIGLAGGAATGAYIVWLHLKDFSNLTMTPWGGRAVTLTGFALLLLLLRVAQHLRRGDDGARTFLRIAEAVTGLFVLLASSYALITTPPVQSADLWSATARSQGVAITIERHPFERDRLRLTFEPESGGNIESAVVTATDAGRGIGPIELAIEPRFPGGFAVPTDELVGGKWTLHVTGRRQGAYDATASAVLPESALRQAGPRPCSVPFTLFMAGIALLGVALGAWMVMASSKSRALTLDGSHPRRDVFLAAACCAVLLSYAGMHLIHQPLNAFRRLCESSGHLWHESVPTRDGRIVSDLAVPGCMVGMGLSQRHFSDVRELTPYLRPAHAIATMTTDPAAPEAGSPTMLQFSLRDPAGKPVADLVQEHDKLLHAIVIGQDTRLFSHLHLDTPDRIAGTTSDFEVPFTFPRGGRHIVAVDYAVRARPLAQQFYVDVQGDDQPPKGAGEPTRESIEGPYRVTLDTSGTIRAGKDTRLTFSVTKSGEEVTDLETYLAAPMHLAVVSEDLRKFSHTHGEVRRPWIERALHPRRPGVPSHVMKSAPFGPDIDAYVTFPAAGRYVLFGQFQHEGRVLTARFVVDVERPVLWNRPIVDQTADTVRNPPELIRTPTP
jgi:methionine-rich copper-binding protein CopC/putative copper export protein